MKAHTVYIHTHTDCLWCYLKTHSSLTDVCVCVSEAGSVLPAAAADEEQTFQPGRARHDFHFHRHLEYGLDTHSI